MSKDRLRSIRERLTEQTDPGEWGNEAPHAEAIKEVIHTCWQLILIAWTCIVLFLCVLFFNQGGFVDFSNGSSQAKLGHSTYYLKVSASGETVYTAAENVSHAVREVIMGKVYPTPDAAFDAVLEPLPGNVADAHAVLLCTTKDGVISNNTGGSWHSTYHRRDEGHYRYTKTYHVLNAYPSPVVTDVFYARINLRYC